MAALAKRLDALEQRATVSEEEIVYIIIYDDTLESHTPEELDALKSAAVAQDRLARPGILKPWRVVEL